MSDGPLKLIARSDLQFAPVTTDFAGLAADSLADLPNLLAAIDSDLEAASKLVSDSLPLIASMDADIAELAGILTEMDADDFESIALEIAAAASAGDTLIDTLGGGLSLLDIPF